MIGFTVEINLASREVVTTFRGQRRTFVFDNDKFPLLEAMKVATEDAHGQIRVFLREIAEHVEGGKNATNQD